MKTVFFISLLIALSSHAAPFKLEVDAKWEIVDNDPTLQTYTLNEESTSLGPMKSVSFGRGARELENLPVIEKKWSDWRTRMTRTIASAPASSSCAHPYIFRTSKKNGKSKEKSVCPDSLTKPEKDDLLKLMTEISEYLYGP